MFMKYASEQIHVFRKLGQRVYQWNGGTFFITSDTLARRET